VRKSSSEELKSFGLFLGSFANPPTPAQQQILTQWDVIVLDPLQDGVINALSTCQSSSTHILGRLDVQKLVKSDGSSTSDDVIQSLATISQTLTSCIKQSPFTGVLLANCHTHFQPAVLNRLAEYINGMGFDLFLEMAPPAYMADQSSDIKMQLIRGLVYRNGTIRPNGDRQNYFQMTEMRKAMRAVAAQRVSPSPLTMMW